MLYNGDTFEIDGISFRVSFPIDDCGIAYWQESDCHGPVTLWENRDKRPGELILASDKGSKCFYDFAEACRIARNVWGLNDRKEAAEAARKDFEYLRRWFADQWCYVGVNVTMLDDNGDALPYESQTIWGIESDCHEYLEETARDLAAGLIAELERNLAA